MRKDGQRRIVLPQMRTPPAVAYKPSQIDSIHKQGSHSERIAVVFSIRYRLQA